MASPPCRNSTWFVASGYNSCASLSGSGHSARHSRCDKRLLWRVARRWLGPARVSVQQAVASAASGCLGQPPHPSQQVGSDLDQVRRKRRGPAGCRCADGGVKQPRVLVLQGFVSRDLPTPADERGAQKNQTPSATLRTRSSVIARPGPYPPLLLQYCAVPWANYPAAQGAPQLSPPNMPPTMMPALLRASPCSCGLGFPPLQIVVLGIPNRFSASWATTCGEEVRVTLLPARPTLMGTRSSARSLSTPPSLPRLPALPLRCAGATLISGKRREKKNKTRERLSGKHFQATIKTSHHAIHPCIIATSIARSNDDPSR